MQSRFLSLLLRSDACKSVPASLKIRGMVRAKAALMLQCRVESGMLALL